MNYLKQLVWLMVLLTLTVSPAAADGPDYQIDRHTIAGGSGGLSGGDYTLNGTAGQVDASASPPRGGEYSLSGGFWQSIQYSLYFPLIFKQYPAPDLTITALSAVGGNISLTLENQGIQTVSQVFWVDVYFDPTEIPTVNKPWYAIAPAGAVWGVDANIPPGGSLTLTSGDRYYAPQYSSSDFPAEAQVYGYVDSVDFESSSGNVIECDESNNLYGPVLSATGREAPLTIQTADLPAGLPAR